MALSPSRCLEVSLGTTPQTELASPMFSSRIYCCYGGDLLMWLQSLGKGLWLIFRVLVDLCVLSLSPLLWETELRAFWSETWLLSLENVWKNLNQSCMPCQLSLSKRRFLLWRACWLFHRVTTFSFLCENQISHGSWSESCEVSWGNI